MNPNSGKIILDLCGGTGAWSKPYRDAGYDVRLITLPDYDVTKVEFEQHAMRFILQDTHYRDEMTVLYKDVYGILAAPPCTEFSSAKNGRGVRDVAGALEIVNACERIIRTSQLTGGLRFWALENPKASSSPWPLAKFLGHPAFCFEQWQFGGKAKKATNIWGFFKPPAPTVTIPPDQFETMGSKHAEKMHYKHPVCPDWCREYIQQIQGSTARRAALRAITPPGFAQAFYKANK